MNPNFTFAIKTTDVPEKKPLCISVEGISLAVGKNKSEFYAVSNLCPHAASTFDGGKIKAYFIVCPMHGVMFDMRNGEPRGDLAKSALTTYAVEVRNTDELWIAV